MVQPKTAVPASRKYGNTPLSKRESEIAAFLQTGSNNFYEAYTLYSHRRKCFRMARNIVSWFNSGLKALHSKGLFLEIPFIYRSSVNFAGSWYGYVWSNPGVNGSKANYQAFTLHDAQMEQHREMNKII